MLKTMNEIFDYFENAILPVSYILIPINYTLAIDKYFDYDEDWKRNITATYTNPNIDRKVFIMFQPGNCGGNGYVVSSIESSQGNLYLREYLKVNNKPTASMEYDPRGTLANHLKLLIENLEEDFRLVIYGEKWIHISYDPRDDY
jgi:hypothetical protein